MNININLPLYYFKPNFVQLINKNYIEHYFIKGSKELTSKIVKKNKKANKYLSKYIDKYSFISYSFINNSFIYYYSSSLTDFLFNLIKISSYNNNLPLNSIESFSLSKTLYLISKFIQPIFLEKIRIYYLGNLFLKGIKFSNVILKMLYMIKDDFMYTDLLDYIFGIMTVTNSDKKISKENDIYLTLIFFFIFISYRSYENIKQKEIKKEKEKKRKIKIINEIKKNEVIPIPDNKIYSSRNKNFNNLIKNKKGLCLICNNKFNSPSAIKCCGGVFCFKCIYNYLIIHQKCFLCLQNIFLEKSDINKILIKLYP